MRVIAGELGGRKLHVPAGRHVRPASDRVREAVFSMLGDLSAAAVLDLYCGSGAYGIEALSRGAASAVFVDLDISACARNVEELGIADGRARLVPEDAVRFAAAAGGPFDLVFCDPPYRIATSAGPELGPHLGRILRTGGRVIAESGVRAPISLDLALVRERSYGDSMIRIYEAGATHG